MPSPADFAGRIAPAVIQQCINTGVFPSVVIAQAIQESGSGTSKLAQLANNLFGHMASTLYPGKKIQLVHDGKLWRAYNSVLDCIGDHIGILKHAKYQVAGVIRAKTPYQQAQALQSAGYDTGPDEPQYAAKLTRLITMLNLQQYDKQMQAAERKRNKGLTYHELPAINKVIKNLIG